nr:unnamed protein product [Callosobruchus analis]
MSKRRPEDHVAYSEAAIRNNLSIVEYCRTCFSNFWLYSRRTWIDRIIWSTIFHVCCNQLLVHAAFQSRP